MIKLSRLAIVICGCLAVLTAGQSFSQSSLLNEIRLELERLAADLEIARQNYGTESSIQVPLPEGRERRLEAIEADLRSAFGRLEELQYRVNLVADDGTERLKNLELRLVELEGGDASTIGKVQTLGASTVTDSKPDRLISNPEGSQEPTGSLAVAGLQSAETGTDFEVNLAIGERPAFDAAEDAWRSGNYQLAVSQFTSFAEAYPLSPFIARVHLNLGRSHAALGNKREAARAYLESYTLARDQSDAAPALWRLGDMLAELGKTHEACTILTETQLRYPDTSSARDASTRRLELDCM